MVGDVSEQSFASLKDSIESEQTHLSSFGSAQSPTTIAVVRAPRDTGIDDLCDEWIPELGMPKWALERFWEFRSGYRTNTAVDNPTQRAWNDAKLDYHYRNYLNSSEEAQAALQLIVDRLYSGEDITLVCFEERPDPCHRHILLERIENLLDARSGRFEITAD